MTIAPERPLTVQSPESRLAEVDRQLAQIQQAYHTGLHGWDLAAQDHRLQLRRDRAALLGELGRDSERLALLRELALEA